MCERERESVVEVREARVIDLKEKQVKEKEAGIEGFSDLREGSEKQERSYRQRSGSCLRSGGEDFMVKPFAGLVFVVAHYFFVLHLLSELYLLLFLHCGSLLLVRFGRYFVSGSSFPFSLSLLVEKVLG